MKKTILFAGIAAMALVSCAKDEELASVRTSEDNQIRFSVVSDKLTRNTPVDHGTILTTQNLPEFQAFGITSDAGLDAEPELNWSVFKRGADNIFTFTGNQIPRWTSNKPMDFFAFYSGDQDSGPLWTGLLKYSTTSQYLKMLENANGENVKTWKHHYDAVQARNVDHNEYRYDGWDDFIYAVSRNVRPTNETISLNFRHALSQICFKAVNRSSEDLDIEIAGFKLDRVRTSGTMTWAKGDTNVDFIPDLKDMFQEGGNNPDDFCSWEIDYSKQATDSYLNYFSFAGVEPGVKGNTNALTIKLTDQVQDLTGHVFTESYAPQPGKTEMKPWFIIPQKFTKWDGTRGNKSARILVLVKITPKDRPEKYPDYIQTVNGQQIHNCYKGTMNEYNESIFVWAAVAPVSKTTWEEDGTTWYEWQQNRKYVYTLIFNGTQSGLVPEPEPDGDGDGDDDDDKDPVVNLVDPSYQYHFGITVDEYDLGTGSEVQMPGANEGSNTIG